MIQPGHAHLIVIGVTEGGAAHLSPGARAGRLPRQVFHQQFAMQRELAIEALPHGALAEHSKEPGSPFPNHEAPPFP